MTQAKISVIIPVYNVEAYLRQCLYSIINQTLKELEIICINDGSTDNSLAILNEYAENDSRIIIIDQANGGTGNALNNGIKTATAEYVTFVGSDDWADLSMYEQLYKVVMAHGSEIVICEHAYFNPVTNKIYQPDALGIPIDSKFDNKSFDWAQIPDEIFQINSGPCNKLFKTDFVKTLEAKFAEGLYYQDILFVFKCLLSAKSISYIRKPLYIIRYLRPGSTTTDKGRRQFDIFEVMHQLETEIYKMQPSELLIIKFREYKRSQFLHHFNLIDTRYKREFWDRMQSELNPSAAQISKFQFWLLINKIRILEKIKSISLLILGKHALKFTKLYRAVQGRMVK